MKIGIIRVFGAAEAWRSPKPQTGVRILQDLQECVTIFHDYYSLPGSREYTEGFATLHKGQASGFDPCRRGRYGLIVLYYELFGLFFCIG